MAKRTLKGWTIDGTWPAAPSSRNGLGTPCRPFFTRRSMLEHVRKRLGFPARIIPAVLTLTLTPPKRKRRSR